MSDSDDPHSDRLNRARERMGVDYDDAPPRRKPREPRKGGSVSGMLGGLGASMGSGFKDSDPLTRRLTYGALGLGGLLVLGIGGWSMMGGHHGGIPVIAPPAGPVRDKPANPGGMELQGVPAPSDSEANVAKLAPGPEQPDPDALAKRYGGKTAGDAPAATEAAPDAPAAATASTPAASPAPAVAPPATSALPDAATVGGKDARAPAAAPEPAPARAPVATQPLPPAAPVPTRASSAPAALPPPAAAPEVAQQEAPPQVAASGPYGVQLAALNTEAGAREEWARVMAANPDLLSGRSPIIEKTTHDTSVFYRLRLRGFDTIAAAQAFCVKLRAHGHACTPLRP